MDYAIEVKWIRCGEGAESHWCSLETLDLTSPHFNNRGVYIIWPEGSNPNHVVRVGQGKLGQRLGAHRKDQEILGYQTLGKLRTTWALVESPYRDGVERYLAEKLEPLVGERFPDAEPIMVNLPWE